MTRSIRTIITFTLLLVATLAINAHSADVYKLYIDGTMFYVKDGEVLEITTAGGEELKMIVTKSGFQTQTVGNFSIAYSDDMEVEVEGDGGEDGTTISVAYQDVFQLIANVYDYIGPTTELLDVTMETWGKSIPEIAEAIAADEYESVTRQFGEESALGKKVKFMQNGNEITAEFFAIGNTDQSIAIAVQYPSVYATDVEEPLSIIAEFMSY